MWRALLLSFAWGGVLLSAAEVAGPYKAIAERVWRNECAGSVQGLVSWNIGESFPSLGIGHFIWYPAGQSGPFEESFPKMIAFAAKQGEPIPAFLRGAAPWPNRAAFLADRSGLADRIRQWLAGHVELQTRYLRERAQAALPVMLRSSRRPEAVRAWFNALAESPQGVYCLVDYVNFKGEGVKPTERYAGQGWGLLQVLEEMSGTPSRTTAPGEFARAAERVIRRRVQNAPPSRREDRWLPGWLNRCRTYRSAM